MYTNPIPPTLSSKSPARGAKFTPARPRYTSKNTSRIRRMVQAMQVLRGINRLSPQDKAACVYLATPLSRDGSAVR